MIRSKIACKQSVKGIVNVKKVLVLGILSAVILPLLVFGCKAEQTSTTTPLVPALQGGQEAVRVTITTDEFGEQNHIVRDVELTPPGSLIVTLGTNPTTGYQWEEAVIGDTSLIEQDSRNYVAPPTTGGTVGAPGKAVWVFNSLKTGTTTISMSYSRLWTGGEKDTWTLVLNLTVK
jgi:predicted secreted protein